ncbi:MAG: hypothetical protein V1775_01970 [Bacteroidota bacterium]
MKNSLILLIAVLFTSAYHGFCQKNDLNRLNLKGKISSINEKAFQPISDGATLSKGRMVQWYRNTFNTTGNKVEDIKFKADSTIDKRFVYTYNEKGNRQELNVFSADNLLTLKVIYQYDLQGNLLEDISYDGTGQIGKKIVYLYDEYGNVMEENIYNPDGVLRQKYRYNYSNENNRTETSLHKGSGELERRITYKRDEKGNETEENTFSFDGSLLFSSTNLYEYDKKGNWIKKTNYSNNKPVSITERKILYF